MDSTVNVPLLSVLECTCGGARPLKTWSRWLLARSRLLSYTIWCIAVALRSGGRGSR